MVRVARTNGTRTTDDVSAPTLADPLARSASHLVSGPVGRHARTGRSWWTPLRVTLALLTIVFSLGVLQKSPCVVTSWAGDPSPKPFSHMCYSDMQNLYVARGLAEGIFPYTPIADLPFEKQPETIEDRHTLMIEYPVLTGFWMGATGWLTRQLGEDPDVSQISHGQVGQVLGVQHDAAVFWGVNAVGFFLVMILAIIGLVRAQPRRPWDAVFIAGSPMLALAGFINFDILALGLVAGALWAWARRRPVLAGVFIGLGAAAKLYPLFLLGPLLVLCLRERKLRPFGRLFVAAAVSWLAVNVPIMIWSPEQWMWFWRFNAERGPDLGSLWLFFSMIGHTASAAAINAATWVLFGLACLLIAALALLARRRPRLPQLAFLVVASFLLVNKVYSPQYVLWLLPLAALARPRWRDLIIWQACELFYFFAVWMHLANFFVSPGQCTASHFLFVSSGCDWVYGLSILFRVAGEVYLMAIVVRDILLPWHDPVRADGLSDDPLGGILDEGIDAEPMPYDRSTRGAGDSADRDAVEARGREPDVYADLLADGGDGNAGRQQQHADLHVRGLDEPAMPACDDVRGAGEPGDVEAAARR